MFVKDLVGEALVRLGYPTDLIPSARGSIVIRNWKPLPMEKVADEPLRTVGDILAELTTVATLKIQVYRSRPPPPSPAAEVRDKLLRLLLLHSHALLVSAGCPLDEVRISCLLYVLLLFFSQNPLIKFTVWSLMITSGVPFSRFSRTSWNLEAGLRRCRRCRSEDGRTHRW